MIVVSDTSPINYLILIELHTHYPSYSVEFSLFSSLRGGATGA